MIELINWQSFAWGIFFNPMEFCMSHFSGHIALVSMFKIQAFVLFLVDHLPHSIVPVFVLLLSQFAIFTYHVVSFHFFLCLSFLHSLPLSLSLSLSLFHSLFLSFLHSLPLPPSLPPSFKLANPFTYLGINISSTESDVNIGKAWTAIDSLSIIWKSELIK